MGALQQALLASISAKALGDPPYVFDSFHSDGFRDTNLYIPEIPDGGFVLVLAANASLNTITLNSFNALTNQQANDSNDLTSRVFYKAYPTGVFDEERAFNVQAGWVYMVFEGVDLDDPFGATTKYATGIDSAQPVPPSIVCPENGIIVTLSSSVCVTSSNLVNPAGSSANRETNEGWRTSFNENVVAHDIAVYNAAQSGTPVGTITRSGSSTSDGWASTVLVLKS